MKLSELIRLLEKIYTRERSRVNNKHGLRREYVSGNVPISPSAAAIVISSFTRTRAQYNVTTYNRM